jgi:hypothetical protein
MCQRLGVRRGAKSLLARHYQTGALQQRSDGAGGRPSSPWLVPLEHPLELPRAPAHVRLSQLQNHLLDILRRVVVMPLRGTTVLHQSGHSSMPVATQPDIPGLSRDLIPLAQLGHRLFVSIVLEYKTQLLFHYTARFPWHAVLFRGMVCAMICARYARVLAVLGLRRPEATASKTRLTVQVRSQAVTSLRLISWQRRCRLPFRREGRLLFGHGGSRGEDGLDGGDWRSSGRQKM